MTRDTSQTFSGLAHQHCSNSFWSVPALVWAAPFFLELRWLQELGIEILVLVPVELLSVAAGLVWCAWISESALSVLCLFSGPWLRMD